ncbi:major outer membrane protein [Legionella wadsworthii]|uniref:Major outer membrane protein n=1 Tax=Legionella wadsworthii TaxID=28088 RepID=A0A378LSD2_9GAMM|nr:Lpg1974 family pore-forming outer membrane protein [Legionella wadsworthii]STY29875.1 major outer membrane protein [Legionella wadsworthii]
MTLKFLPLVLASLSLASHASPTPLPKYIDKDGPVCTNMLCAFKSPGGFYISGTGYYVQPSETGLGLVTDSWLFTVPGGTQAQSKPFEPDYQWAGSVALGYDIPMSANNIEINYLYLKNRTHAVNSFANGSFLFGSILFPDASIPIEAMPTLVSDAFLTYRIDQGDVRVGRKYSDTSGVFRIRPSLGVRYAQIRHDLTFAAPGTVTSKFSGAGPLFSVDAHYGLPYGFGLLGYFDYALMAGSMQSFSQVFLGTNFSFSWPQRNRVVNNIVGKIGLDYTHPFSTTASWTAAVGYQINEYLSSMDTLRGFTGIGGLGPQRIAGNETNNFSFQGLFLSLTLHA